MVPLHTRVHVYGILWCRFGGSAGSSTLGARLRGDHGPPFLLEAIQAEVVHGHGAARRLPVLHREGVELRGELVRPGVAGVLDASGKVL